jgi:hypothetical protein
MTKYEIKQNGQDGRSLGEFSIDTIRDNVQTGAIEESYLARKDGASEWITVSSLLGDAAQRQDSKPSVPDEQRVKEQKAKEQKVITICFFCGGGLFTILNLATGGAVPGGFQGGIVGGMVGAVVGVIINFLNRK